MDRTQSRYPIGQQDFRNLREGDAIYVDKTSYVEKIARSNSRYYFLARPRRFGKSLFLSTLRYFFEGKWELFKGLYIDSADWDWQPYPVLRLDLNINRYDEPGLLDRVLDNLFREWEAEYEVKYRGDDLSSRFRNIIKAAHERTGRQVVILVDEYDKPLVGNLNNDGNFEHYRAKLASVYSNFKSSAEHIRLVFLTGVSRFSKLSVFSDLNNLNDITFDNHFADICGITEAELLDNFKEGISSLADFEMWSYEETCARLKRNYDGYRFTPGGSDIYNPWSVLCCLSNREIGNYWNMTGTPTIVAEMLKRCRSDLKKILNTKCEVDTIKGLDLRSADPLAMLFQTGYITIKDYDRASGLVTLGIPNEEVKSGFFKVLANEYVKTKHEGTEVTVRELQTSIVAGEPEMMMRCLQAYFSGIPYDLRLENENNFQNALYILLSLIEVKARVEVHTSEGRIDLLLENPRNIFIIELKFNGTAQEALDQIEQKHYARPFGMDARKVFLIGINFSSGTRTIEDWKIKELK